MALVHDDDLEFLISFVSYLSSISTITLTSVATGNPGARRITRTLPELCPSDTASSVWSVFRRYHGCMVPVLITFTRRTFTWRRGWVRN